MGMSVTTATGGSVRMTTGGQGGVNKEGLGHVVIVVTSGMVVGVRGRETVQGVKVVGQEVGEEMVDDMNDLPCAVGHCLHQMGMYFDDVVDVVGVGGDLARGGRGNSLRSRVR
jgi:hypothetical protein